MNDPKVKQDNIGTLKSMHGYCYNGIMQDYLPQIKHQRLCYVWNGHNGVYQVISVPTETIIVRPRLKL